MTPQPYTPCSRAAQEYAFTLFDDPFSIEWLMAAKAFDAGRVHMAHATAKTLHPSAPLWRQPMLPEAPIKIKAPSYGPAFAETYLALHPIKTLAQLAFVQVTL